MGCPAPAVGGEAAGALAAGGCARPRQPGRARRTDQLARLDLQLVQAARLEGGRQQVDGGQDRVAG